MQCVFHFRLDGTIFLDVSPKPELQRMNTYSQFKYFSVSAVFILSCTICNVPFTHKYSFDLRGFQLNSWEELNLMGGICLGVLSIRHSRSDPLKNLAGFAKAMNTHKSI